MADKFIRLQNDIASKIEKDFKNFKKSPKERITQSYVETRLELLEQNWSNFFENNRRIVYETDEVILHATTYYTGETYDKTQESYFDYKTLLKDTLLKCKPESQQQTNSLEGKSTDYKSNVKLPKITIPKFSGKYAEWTSFRDLFVSLVDSNQSIDDVQKLHYLKGCLTGESEQLVRNIPCTAKNYKYCWSQLESRYNNKKFISTSILKKLTTQKVLTNESASGLRQLLDTTKECLSALKNIGIDISSWDIIVIFILSQKLDHESRKEWEQRVCESMEELPSLTMFTEFLETKFRSLEFLDPKIQKQEKNTCTHVTTANENVTCVYCSANHKIGNCKKFAKEGVDTRRNFVQINHLCFNCLAPDHSVYQCNLSTRCRLCKKKHHSLLHPKNLKSAKDYVKADQSGETNIVATVTEATSSSQTQGEVSDPQLVYFSNTSSQVLLATALVNVEAHNKTTCVLRSLLDQGSQASFVTEAAVQLLGLKKDYRSSTVSGLGGDQGSTLMSKSSVVLKIQSRLDPSFTVTVKAHVLNKLTTLLPSRKVLVQALPRLTSLELADPSFETPNQIDLLLGAEVYSQILLEGLVRGSSNSVIAQDTRFGWILSGRVHTEHTQKTEDEQCHNIVVSLHTTENELLKKFWELESESSLKKEKHLNQEEEQCERLYTHTTTRDDTGRFIVKLPFKKDDPLCQYGSSREIAYKRFLMLERRLMRNPSLRDEYCKVINEYLEMGHMELVSKADVSKPGAVYLPHHAVVREDKTTSKVRVVFDASCKGTNGVSLNDDLMVGPTLQPELRHLVMRWRCYPIALVGDIVKMYRQVKVAEEDTDFQRILWRENPDAELQHLRLLRVTFGTSSAPYLAVRTLQELALQEGHDFPLASSRMLHDFYMDDLMTGCHSVAEGIKIFEEITDLLNRGGFPLQKYSTNNKELLHQIHADSKDTPHNHELKTDAVMKILGLSWNRDADEFNFIVKLPPVDGPVTKRMILSDIARLFDPLGWIAPIITKAKIFIQRLWLLGVEWDSKVPEELLKDWIDFRSDLPSIVKVRIPRWIHTSIGDECVELHGFSDASNAAYAAVVYVRIIDQVGTVHVQLIASKTRVAPVKQVSIPRLELCGAVLLAKLLCEVGETLEVSKEHWHAWTDSSIVLSWLSNHPSKWKTFVANRTAEILTIMDGNQWSHVASKENPADCASRGLQPSEFVDNELWKEGPTWLRQINVDYGAKKFTETNLEEKKSKMACHTLTSEQKDNDLLSKFSSLRKLVRVVAYCKRVLKWKKDSKDEKLKEWLTVKEIDDALLTCIKICQKKCFSEEINDVARGKLRKNSKIANLNPFIDSNGVLRVGGRIQCASVNEQMKHPIIVPHTSHFTKLLIDEAHLKTLHGGPQLMLNYLRSKYWIIGAKGLVRLHVHKCVTCIRYAAQTTQQMMGNLPTARVTAHRPFLKSGVDYAGPINIRTTKGRGHRATKGYICLFICMATRAVHLEAVSDMTSESFLAAFKRFVARRGHVADIWSDNGTTFVGSARELKDLFTEERSSVAKEIAEWLASNGTNWHFIPPRSPNFGGLWEAGIKSTKHHLKRVIGDNTLTFEEITTTLAQIEACLNSRPISQLSSNAEDPQPLTPGHFLVGEPLLLPPEANYELSNINSIKRWHLTQKMIQDFWRRWSREYLTQLQQRRKWTDKTMEPEIGNVVLVKEDDLPPARWIYGVVIDKHPGLDNLTRVVTLKYKGNIIKRPVSKLIMLPVQD